MTLFLPIDEAWNTLDPYERLYLESEFAADDLNKILNMHAVVEDRVKWSDSFEEKGATCELNMTLYKARLIIYLDTSLDGTKLEIQSTPNGTTVGSANLVEKDIYAANGVLHLVSDLLIPPGALQITPEKYLLALNCTTFISLLRSVDLRHLVNSTEKHHTILAPSDDILSVLGEASLPEPGSDDLKRMLEYHFIPGKWTPKQLEDGQLLPTELKEEGLKGDRQVLPVDVGSGDPKKNQGGSIRFGGAGVIGEPSE
jgi:solute carrier family 25 (mitochondrial carnitine/acylcarnitine transporter), member 20/29